MIFTKTKKCTVILLALIMSLTFAVGASAEESLTNNIAISDSCTGNININIYSEGSFQNIINNILLNGNYIGGDVKIQIISDDAPDDYAGDFRGIFEPRLF